MRAAALLLVCACLPATAGLRIGKFQVLVERVRLAGTVTAAHGTDFDLALDDCTPAAPWPWMACTVHCEAYGHSGLPAEHDGAVLSVGARVAVSGALVLDNTVHPGEEGGRRYFRGLFEVWRPKLELHPYMASTIGRPPVAPLPTASARVAFFAATYAGTWAWNEALELDGAPEPESWTEIDLVVSPGG